MGQNQSEPNRSATDTPGVRDPPRSNPQEEEQAPPYEPRYGANDQQEWNDCDVPVWTCDTKPQNPFVYGGARPAGIKYKNVILFGETGVGKSSVINLMADKGVASTSSNAEACTLEATEYTFSLAGEPSLRVYDTVGFNEPEMDIDTFVGAIEKAYKLITSVNSAGGIDLLLFCTRGGRITATMQRNYRLFSEFLCEKETPLAFVVTHLEYEEVMEEWWERNKKTFDAYGMRSVSHACITAAPARAMGLDAKRAESRIALQKMFRDSLGNPNAPYVKDPWSWFTRLVISMLKILPTSLRKNALSKLLKVRCSLSPREAQQLADMLARDGQFAK